MIAGTPAMSSIDAILLVAAALLLLSVVASKTSGRLGVPALLVFLAIGMLAGSDGPGGIAFDDPWLAQSLGVVALALILYAGGLDTDWRTVRPMLREGVALATLGVLLTAGILGGLVHLLLGYSLLEGWLLGAIVSSTDAAAVFAVLRARNVRLTHRLKSLLELESGSNDPMAVFLTVSAIHLLLSPEPSRMVGTIALDFVVQMSAGAATGYLVGRGTVLLVNRLRLEYEGLYPVLTLSLVLLTYGASEALGGNGFLAVYVAGLVAGNSDFLHKRSLVRFHDGLAWLMQIVMFLALGLLVFPSRLVTVAGAGLVTALVLMLLARPVSVFLVLAPSRLSLREKTLVAWVGLRGAVPIVLATFPLLAGVPSADDLFDLVFFVVLASVALQGPSIPAVARWLGVEAPPDERPQEVPPVMAGSPRGRLEEMQVGAASGAVGRRILDLGIPRGALVVLLRRGDEVIIPDGGTGLHEGDRLVVLADESILPGIRRLVRGAGDGATGTT
jgi:cell volume regulation protein A